MYFVLTTAGSAAIAASGSPIVFDQYKLGSGSGYTPSVSQVALVGTEVFNSLPSAPVVINTNLLKYSLVLGSNAGPFSFGEVGLYLGGVLMAIGSNASPIIKVATSPSAAGNVVAIDAYLSVVGTSYSIYAEYGNSNNPLKLSALPGVDSLPNATTAYPNIFLVTSPDGTNSVLAFSNNSIWSITGYQEVVATGIVNYSTALSVSSSVPVLAPNYPGELVLQFTSGVNLGTLRTVNGYNATGNVVSFATPMATQPNTNDSFQVIKKTQLRPYQAALLNGLSPTLTATQVNPLENYNLADFVRKQGTVAMLAPLNLGGFRIVSLADPTISTDAANKGYVDTTLSGVNSSVTSLTSQVAFLTGSYFRRDGSLPMTGALNMSGSKVFNLAAPTNAGDAVNKGYLDTVSSALSSSIITSHNGLNSLQGGVGGEYYHLTAAERALVSNLSTSGYPIASYVQSGISSFASAVEVGLGLSNTKGINPEALAAAISAGSGPNSLQQSLQSFVGSYAAAVQFGAGAPVAGVTATTPTIYVDYTTTPFTEYVYRGASWSLINPIVGSTTSPALLKLATSATYPQVANDTVAATPAYVNSSITVQSSPKIQFQSQGTNLGTAGVVTTLNLSGTGVSSTLVGNSLTYSFVAGSGGTGGGATSFNRVSYVATAGQTVFAVTYDVGYVDVYLNGLRLLAGTDFTATTGTNVTLTTSVLANDIVDIVGYSTVTVANTQATLISGNNIKSVGGISLLGSGDLPVVLSLNSLTGAVSLKTVNGLTLTGTGDISGLGSPDFLLQQQGVI